MPTCASRCIPCVYGSTRPDATRVALIGDSHAAALLAMLEPQLDAANWHVTVFVGQTCGWLPPALSPSCPGLRLIQRDLLHDHYAIVIATELRQYTSSVAQHLRRCGPSPPPARGSSSSRTTPACQPRARRASAGSPTARPATVAPPRPCLPGPRSPGAGRRADPRSDGDSHPPDYCRGGTSAPPRSGTSSCTGIRRPM